MKKPVSLTLTYIYLASGCVILGTVLTYILLFVCGYFGINLFKNAWLLAIPSVLSVVINVFLIELYKKIGK